jgi:hypothetical protein
LIRSPIVFSLPAAPAPIAPAEGDSIIIPTFSWQASGGAIFYEIQVGPQSNPNLVDWTDTTQLLRLTPNQALAHGLLYWRVRACSISPCDGAWSSRINFIKYIPAPRLLAPHNHIALTEPTFEWGSVQGAAYYKIEVTTDPTFNLARRPNLYDLCHSPHAQQHTSSRHILLARARRRRRPS